MILHFASDETGELFRDGSHKRWKSIERVAFRKLEQLHTAGKLSDLRSPAGNRLEALKGSRAGQHSIRINNQFRLCFRWHDNNAYDVEIVDYH